MNKKSSDRSRKKTMRLAGWDYSWDEYYYITICTKDRAQAFGEIENGKLIEAAQAKICQSVWLDLPKHYPSCALDAFVIMPDHVHGIIVIDNQNISTDVSGDVSVGAIHELPLRKRELRKLPIPKRGRLSTRGQSNQPAPQTRAQRRLMLIPKIVGRFKMQVASQINILQNTIRQPFWQRNYYDRVIRDEQELNNIREYIWNNPRNWKNHP